MTTYYEHNAGSRAWYQLQREDTIDLGPVPDMHYAHTAGIDVLEETLTHDEIAERMAEAGR